MSPTVEDPEDLRIAFSRPISVAKLPPDGLTLTVTATRQECDQLAEDFGILGISALSATFTLTEWRKSGVRLKGQVDGVATQACSVTLDPVDETISEEVDLDFLPEELIKPVDEDVEVDADDRDPPEAIIDEHIDLGLIASEYLALGLDPYPRKEGVVFEGYVVGDDAVYEKPNPFAQLAQLKDPKG